MKRYVSEEIRNFVSRPLFDKGSQLNKNPDYPRISVIIPSFNQAQYLERTILSILNQNYPNLELILIDGGSTDGSVDIIKRYEKYLAYWRSEVDDGQTDAINKGCRLAKGDLIGWLNSDDLYLPGALIGVADTFKASPALDLIFGNNYLIRSDDSIIKEHRWIPFSLEHLLYCGWNLSTQSAFWSRAVMDKVGSIKNLNILFDLDWFIRLGKAARRIEFRREFWGCFRIHGESKYSLVSRESRHPIRISILREHGVDVKEDLAWEKQFRARKFKIQLRWLYFHIKQGELLYMIKTVTRRARGLL
jgi:glycosyltransferase involved in cell wall biosynthesis